MITIFKVLKCLSLYNYFMKLHYSHIQQLNKDLSHRSRLFIDINTCRNSTSESDRLETSKIFLYTLALLYVLLLYGVNLHIFKFLLALAIMQYNGIIYYKNSSLHQIKMGNAVKVIFKCSLFL